MNRGERMPGTYDEETRKLLENRKRKAELRRAQQIKKRNTMLMGFGGIVVVLLLIIVICISCSSGKSKEEEQTTQPQSTTVAEETTTEAETTSAATTMYTTDTLNLRQEPNTDAEIITQIGAGKKVEVLSTEGQWCRVQRGKDTGYVMKRYLSYENTLD